MSSEVNEPQVIGVDVGGQDETAITFMDAQGLRAIRAELGLSQRKMAEALEISIRTYISWENGQNRVPKLLKMALVGARIKLARRAIEKNFGNIRQKK